MKNLLLGGLLAAATTLSSPAYAKIQVHVVPHTHDDIGWLKTVKEYANGYNTTIQNACTDCIITTVVEALRANPDRTFTYVEQGFFQRWWYLQSDETKKATKELVKNGQLTFSNGGWCMHDEAAP